MPYAYNQFNVTNPFLASSAFGGPATAPGSTGTIPSPQNANTDPFGKVPGPISMPTPAADVGAQFPNLPGVNSALSGDIYNKLNGYLSPTTLNSIQNRYGANFGVQNGMPGSQLSWNNVYGNQIGAAENQRQQGIQDYNQTLPVISGTQTVNPTLQSEIQNRNSINAAAPNPQAAQTYAKNLFDQYLQQLRGPGGGTGGGPSGGTSGSGAANPFADSNQGVGALGFGFGTQGQNQQPADPWDDFYGYMPANPSDITSSRQLYPEADYNTQYADNLV